MATMVGIQNPSVEAGLLEKFLLLLESDQFRKAVNEVRTERKIERIVEVPNFVNIDTPRAKFFDVPTPRAVFEDELIKRPVYVDDPITVQNVTVEEIKKTVEVPEYVKKVFEVPDIQYVPELKTYPVPDIQYVPEKKIYEVPDVRFIKKDALTKEMREVLVECLQEAMQGAIADAVKLTPIEKEYDLAVPNIVRKDEIVFSEKVKFREIIVDTVKPHYVCQKCGHEI